MDKLQWKVVAIIKETKHAYTFILQNEHSKDISYEAGQFLTFIFKHRGGEIRRSYSIASTPGIDPLISITVKRIPNGEISRHLISHTRVNNLLTSIAPAGRFTIETRPHTQRQFIFIAAGSGIVPVFSLIKKILKEEILSKIILIYQNHSEHDIIFKTHLEGYEKKYISQFKWISLLSNPESKLNAPQKLNNFLLEKLVLENLIPEKESMFYLCGPPSFMRMALFTLKWMGFTDEQIKKENFTVEFVPPPPLITDISSKQITIHYNKETFKIEAAYPVSILQAALNNNIQLPFSCRSGRCSSCVAKCIKGKVIMSNNEVLTEKDLQNGLVLTCVGYADADLELEF